jgi:hypothetical protein
VGRDMTINELAQYLLAMPSYMQNKRVCFMNDCDRLDLVLPEDIRLVTLPSIYPTESTIPTALLKGEIVLQVGGEEMP